MHPLIPWSVAGLLGCLPMLPAQGAPAALALDGVRVVDVERGQSGTPRCVRIEDGVIVRIARPGARACRRDAVVVPSAGRYLLPGLIDMHVHLAGTPYVAGFEAMRFADAAMGYAFAARINNGGGGDSPSCTSRCVTEKDNCRTGCDNDPEAGYFCYFDCRLAYMACLAGCVHGGFSGGNGPVIA